MIPGRALNVIWNVLSIPLALRVVNFLPSPPGSVMNGTLNNNPVMMSAGPTAAHQGAIPAPSAVETPRIPIVPPDKKRKLIVCVDGTSGQFSDKVIFSFRDLGLYAHDLE
jgi:hypothetical protein